MQAAGAEMPWTMLHMPAFSSQSQHKNRVMDEAKGHCQGRLVDLQNASQEPDQSV